MPREKPKKPYRDFPLFAHPNGQWAKKIHGRPHYFGVWDDPQGALQRYLQVKDDLFAGRTPRPNSDQLTVRDLCIQYLAYQEARVERGEITAKHFRECTDSCKLLVGKMDHQVAEEVRAQDFTSLVNSWPGSWGPSTRACHIRRIKAAFNWGWKEDLLPNKVKFGEAFRPAPKRVFRQLKNQQKRTFTAAEIRTLIEATDRQLKGMVLLGINAGFGNTDCATLPLSVVDLENAWIRWHRPKTGLTRECPLWPETVAAIKDVPSQRRSSASDLVFLTKYGRPWRTQKSDPLSQRFHKLAQSTSIEGSFYMLRHTFETVGGDSRDQVAVAKIMGHVSEHISAEYRHAIDPQRLLDVANHVRDWLGFPPAARWETPGRIACFPGERAEVD